VGEEIAISYQLSAISHRGQSIAVMLGPRFRS
jgi:hypothetical protein